MNRRFRKSLGYAKKGLKRVFLEEKNFRIQVCVGILVLFLGILLHIPAGEMVLLLSTIFFVLILECINTAFETVSDMIKPRLSDQVKMVKDIMAGAVLLGAIFSVTVGVYIFVPYLREILNPLFESLSVL